MSNLVEALSNTVLGLFQSIFAVVQAFFHAVLSFFSGTFTFVWGLLETIGSVLGVSIQFVYENYIAFGIIALVFICIMDRNQRGAKADRPRRKRTEKTL